MRATCVRYNRSNARPSPEAASATSAVSASRPVWLRSLRSVATPGVVSSMCLIRYGLGVKGCSGSGRLRAVTTSLSAPAGLGLVLGLRHAFEPDHLAAVSTLATRFAPAADFLVALLLIGLGGSVLWRYARGRWHLHVHAHGQGGEPHLHLHSHVHGVAHQHTHPRGDAGRSLGFGLLHGLAGSAALLLLLVAAAPTRGAQLAYFLVFAAGTTIGMLCVSFSLAGMVRLAAGRSARWVTLLHLGSAAASAMVGVALAGRVAGVL